MKGSQGRVKWALLQTFYVLGGEGLVEQKLKSFVRPGEGFVLMRHLSKTQYGPWISVHEPESVDLRAFHVPRLLDYARLSTFDYKRAPKQAVDGAIQDLGLSG